MFIRLACGGLPHLEVIGLVWGYIGFRVPRIRGTILEVTTFRTTVFGVYIGVPLFFATMYPLLYSCMIPPVQSIVCGPSERLK